MMNESMRFSPTLLEHSLLVLFRKSDVKSLSPVSMHKFDTMYLKFSAAEPVHCLCDVGKAQNPFLE